MQPPLYGFDLVTDTADAFVDATRHRILTVGISAANGEEVFEASDETELLTLVDRRLAELPAGVIVTWQGSLLDLPLFSVRCRAAGVTPGLRLRPDHRPSPPSVLLDLDHPWCANWYGHQHLELRRVYDSAGRWWNPLRSRLDPETMIPPSNDLASRDPRKDARLARALAERRWARARKSIDRMPERADWIHPSTVTGSVEHRTGT